MIKTCNVCGKEKEIIAKGKCWPCYQRERRKIFQEPCSLCGRIKLVAARKNGQPACPACYKREIYQAPQEECSLCGKVKQVEARKDGKAVCSTCYQRQRRAKMKSSA